MKLFISLAALLLGSTSFAQVSADYSCVVQGTKGIYLGKNLSAKQITDLTTKAQLSATGEPETVVIGTYAGSDYSVEFHSYGISLLVVKDGQEIRASGAGMQATYSVTSKDNSLTFACLRKTAE